MGVYAETSGATIACKNKKVALKVAKVLKAKSKKGDEDGNQFAYDIEVDKDIIYFRATSGRVQNLEWQMAEIWKAIKNIKGVKELNAPFLMEGDGVFFSVE